MLENAYAFLSLTLGGVALGWATPFGAPIKEEPSTPLNEPTPWKQPVTKSLIAKFAVSPSGMYDVVTEDRKHIMFFDKSNFRNTFILDVGQHNDVPRITYRTRLVPPRILETEVVINAKTYHQFWNLRMSEREMYQYLLKENMETI